MNTEKLFQICVSSMAVLATLMLGTSQGNSLLPLFAFCAAVLALVFTDFLGWFRFHPIVAGGFGLLAGIYAFSQMQTNGVAGQFVSVANLLIHLQVILLFQQKSIRIYWQLITLSLLQVVVAAALNLFVFFGPLLVLYTGISILAMITFFVYRETFPFFELGSQTDRNSLIQIETAQGMFADRSRPRQKLFRLSGLRSFFMLSISTLLASASVFLFMPRFGDGVWRPTKTSIATTGFSGSVDLDDVGTLFENPSMVMRVNFIDESTKKPYKLSGSPYLRGSVSDEYSKGRWTRLQEFKKSKLKPLPRPQRIFSAVRQTVNLEASKGSVVFCLSPVCALDDTSPSMLIDQYTNEARFFPEGNEDSATYSLGTLSLHNGQQSAFSPIRAPLNPTVESRRSRQVTRGMTQLADLASEILRDSGDAGKLERARRLTAYFTDRANGFKYSLDASSERQRGVDPVIDFVMNHRSGHCQFYASALALMLRSQGISSRVVVGYLGNSYNVVGDYYEIREMDAHAWVEAAIPASEIPADEVLPREGIPGDAWVRLDPTPSPDVVIESVTISPWKTKIGDTLDYMQLLWSQYVLGLNEKRQRRAIYEPLQQFFKSSAILLFSPDSWAARWEALLDRFRGEVFSRDNFRDFVIAVAILTAGFYALRAVWRLLGRSVFAWRRRKKSLGPKVDFYVRLEKLLSLHGLRRPTEQTPQEFANVARHHLQRLAADPALLGIPQNTVDLFYRVRFGGDRLDTEEVQRLENALGRLKEFLTNRNRPK